MSQLGYVLKEWQCQEPTKYYRLPYDTVADEKGLGGFRKFLITMGSFLSLLLFLWSGKVLMPFEKLEFHLRYLCGYKILQERSIQAMGNLKHWSYPHRIDPTSRTKNCEFKNWSRDWSLQYKVRKKKLATHQHWLLTCDLLLRIIMITIIIIHTIYKTSLRSTTRFIPTSADAKVGNKSCSRSVACFVYSMNYYYCDHDNT